MIIINKQVILARIGRTNFSSTSIRSIATDVRKKETESSAQPIPKKLFLRPK
jgi:hypothetical protein